MAATPLLAGEHVRIRWSSGWNQRVYEAQGEITPSDDDRSIRAISPGGYVRIEEGSWLDANRTYEIRADGSGQLTHTYRVGGIKREMDPQAAAWASSAVMDLVRETGIGAPERVQRLLSRGGPPAVLTFVARLRSDGSKTTHLRELIQNGKLTTLEMRDALRAGRRIGSDGDRTRLLIDVRPLYSTPELESAWFVAVASIGSDGDHRRALEYALEKNCVGPCLDLVARTAERIGSDGDKSAVLERLAERYSPAIRGSFFRAARTIGSDGDRRKVLIRILRNPARDRYTTLDLLQAAGAIGSDGDKAAVLSEISVAELDEPTVQRAFLRTAAGIGSDGDRSNLLRAGLRHKPAMSARIMIVEAARGIGSDGDKAAVLREVAAAGLDDPELRKAYFEAANTIGSEGDRMEVIRAALRDDSKDPDAFLLAIDSARRIGSESERSQILKRLLQSPFPNEAVWDAFFGAANTIGSDGERLELLREVLKQRTLSKDVVLATIQSAARLGSDNDKASVLLAVVSAPHGSDAEVRTQIRRVLDTVGSDGDYRRVSRVLDSGK